MAATLVVYKRSMYELYRGSPDKKARDFVNGNTPDAVGIRNSHETQQKTLEIVVSALEAEGIKHEEIYRAKLQAYSGIDKNDLVVSVGGDGTFLEVSHYLSKVPLLGVNSDPKTSIGFFCTADAGTFQGILRNIRNAKLTELSRLELELDGKRMPKLVLNEILVAHTNPATVTRYRLSADNFRQEYKCSGLLVCTPAGSTAWMYNEGGVVMPLTAREMQYFSRGLRGESPKFVKELAVQSLTREGKIYVDGAHVQYDFTLGSQLRIRSGSPLTVVGDLEAKRLKF
ncbi:MAG: NAD(+)/NADH kinase [Candidatus Woesearchaeota archaeon]